ncbi:MAG: TRAP transporter small permease [Oscillospiraceae bacterium]|nr:TRAP transporter small permease [Oscillospiraceae bacterium]
MKKKITLKGIVLNLDAIITCVTLSLCTILVNANIFSRYLFNSPILWAEEVATSLFIWTVFVGSAYAYRTHAHLGVDILVKALPEKAKKGVNIVIDIIEIAVLLMLTYVSAQYVANSWTRVTDVLMMPRWYFSIAVPIGFGWSLLYAIYFFVQDLRGKGKEEESNDTGVY